MRFPGVLAPSVVLLLSSVPAGSQEIISAQAGTVHFSEGAVFIDNHPVDRKPATFASIPEGGTLSTEKGRAEVLLTPNVVLRMDENSAIRLASSSLTDTQVEFLRGSIIVDTNNVTEEPPVTVLFQHSKIRFLKPGVYRIDSDTGVLQAYAGQAQVTTAEGKKPEIDSSKLFFFDLGTTTNKFGEPNEDEFYDWARGRADAIAAENQLASEANADQDDDSASAPGIFTSPLPSYGVNPPYSGLGGYALTDPWFTPLFGYAGGAFAPYSNIFPIFVVVRPRTWQTGSQWPHRPPSSVYTPIRVGTSVAPIHVPVYTPRPVGSTAPRPTVSTPRPSVSRPVVVHPMVLHR